MSDLAKSTFVGRINPLIRWLVFLPLAALAALLGPIVIAIGWEFTTGVSDSLFLKFAQDFWTGIFFVGGGAFLAPKHQFAISIFLLVILSMFGLFAFLANNITQTTSPLLMFVHTVLTIGAGAYFVYMFHEEEKKNPD